MGVFPKLSNYSFNHIIAHIHVSHSQLSCMDQEPVIIQKPRLFLIIIGTPSGGGSCTHNHTLLLRDASYWKTMRCQI